MEYNQMVNPTVQQMGPIPSQPAMAPVVQPQQSGMPVEGPPTSPEDAQARTQGWTAWFDKVRTDPAMQQTLLHVGGVLMQGEGAGESTMGLAGRALLSGQQYLGFARGNQQTAAAEEKKQAMQEQIQKSNIDQNTAQTARIKQQTALAPDESAANIRQSDASTRSSDSTANKNNFEIKNKKWLWDNMGPQERKMYSLDSKDFGEIQLAVEGGVASLEHPSGDPAADRITVLRQVMQDRVKSNKQDGKAKVAGALVQLSQQMSNLDKNDPNRQALQASFDTLSASIPGKSDPAAGAPTQADLEHTAQLHGMTVDQVKAKLGIK